METTTITFVYNGNPDQIVIDGLSAQDVFIRQIGYVPSREAVRHNQRAILCDAAQLQFGHGDLVVVRSENVAKDGSAGA